MSGGLESPPPAALGPAGDAAHDAADLPTFGDLGRRAATPEGGSGSAESPPAADDESMDQILQVGIDRWVVREKFTARLWLSTVAALTGSGKEVLARYDMMWY